MKGILGTKIGMTQVWQGDRLIPVTVVMAGPCPVTQRKTPEKDGYSAVQLGWEEKLVKRASKPELGHAKAANAAPQKHLVEFRDFIPEGDKVDVNIFANGQLVDVLGTTKGRGTMGVMRRWNFSGMSASHGVKKKHRHPGSIGQRKQPGRVYKGKRMAGVYGGEQVTISGLTLLEVRPNDNLLLIKGAIPGANGSLVVVKDSKRVKKGGA
jgi:large subunit ribosomal protein L3